MWVFKISFVEKAFSQIWHLWFLWFSWTCKMWVFKYAFVEKAFSQIWHLASFWFSWTCKTCSFKYVLLEKAFSQIWQLWSFLFSWTDFKCLLKLVFQLKAVEQMWQLKSRSPCFVMVNSFLTFGVFEMEDNLSWISTFWLFALSRVPGFSVLTKALDRSSHFECFCFSCTFAMCLLTSDMHRNVSSHLSHSYFVVIVPRSKPGLDVVLEFRFSGNLCWRIWRKIEQVFRFENFSYGNRIRLLIRFSSPNGICVCTCKGNIYRYA